jgi:hypothetical protein
VEFLVMVDAADVAADQIVPWSVDISDNGGQTVREASAGGNLTTAIRVLNVTSTAVTGPAGVFSDGTATAGQENLTVESIVANYASAPLTVDPTLVSNVAGDTITDQDPVEIAAGATHTFSFPVTLANSTTAREFIGDASAPGAEAMADPSPLLTVQAATAFSYVNNTLLTRAARSGSTQNFVVTLSKTGTPAVTLDSATLSFTKGTDTFSTDLSAPLTYAKNTNSKVFTFDPVTIPGDATGALDGVYAGSVTLTGTDDNGASVSRTVSINTPFEIDNLAPHVVPSIAGPTTQVDASGTSTAADGDTLDFSGAIMRGPGATDLPDTSATVTACDLVLTDRVNVEVSRTAIPAASCTNNAGSFDGSTTLSGALANGRAFLEATVVDTAGNTLGAVRSSSFVVVDNTAPSLASAVTGCGPNAADGCEDLKTIRVNLSEPVKGGFLPLDFLVDGDLVVGATSGCTATSFCDQVVLTLLQGFDENDRPVVDYAFRPIPTRTSPADGAANTLPVTGIVGATDGIVPELPALDTVTQDGLNATGEQVSNAMASRSDLAVDGFYTNQESPTFEISGLESGYTALVALDTNGQGGFQPDPVVDAQGQEVAAADTIVASCVSEGASVACAPTTPFPGDGTYELLVASRDGEGNLSEGSTGPLAGARAVDATLIIDNVAPSGRDFLATAANDVTVNLTETVVAGRDFASDWRASTILDNGKTKILTVASVGGSDSLRTITIGEAGFSAADVDGIRYSFSGDPNERYQDAAGNYVANFGLTASTS